MGSKPNTQSVTRKVGTRNENKKVSPSKFIFCLIIHCTLNLTYSYWINISMFLVEATFSTVGWNPVLASGQNNWFYPTVLSVVRDGSGASSDYSLEIYFRVKEECDHFTRYFCFNIFLPIILVINTLTNGIAKWCEKSLI